MEIRRVDRQYADRTIALLDELQVSLFGVQSHPLHVALASDAIAGTIDARVALEDASVRGVVLAAPSRYWRLALLKHWRVASACLRARLRHAGTRPTSEAPGESAPVPSSPPRTWDRPGGAWRIIFIGTTRAARGQGVASRLYGDIMSNRSLVARIARDNVASLRLHESLGWQLYPDGDVVLAVHQHDVHTTRRSA
jgi:GNAT superfamily N-acetyltransferase